MGPLTFLLVLLLAWEVLVIQQRKRRFLRWQRDTAMWLDYIETEAREGRR